MATQVQLRRGTTAQNNSFTGAVGEVTVDTDKDTLRVHDGGTAGGYELAKSNQQAHTNIDINSGTIDGTTIGGSSAAAGTFTNLEANGTIKLDGNYPVGTSNVALGDAALDDAGLTGGSNTAVGACALTANTTGCNNSAFGAGALICNTTGNFNTATGLQPLRCNTTGGGNAAYGANVLCSNTTGSSNTAVGANSLCLNVAGDQSTAVGVDALRNQNPVGNADMNNVAVGFQAALCTTTGVNNTAVGACSLLFNTTGESNAALGRTAMLGNTTGGCNVAVGMQAMQCNTTGVSNTVIGQGALFSNTTGTLNTAIGREALRSNVAGDQSTAVGVDALRNQNPVGNADMNNVAVGFQAALCTTTGCSNSAFGTWAMRLTTTGASNVALGRNALCTNVTGSGNTAVGVFALEDSTGASNTAVGNSALFDTTGDNSVALGANALRNATTGNNNIGIGVNAGRTGGGIAGICNITTESNYIVMGNDDHTCALIKVAWTATSDCRDKTCFRPIEHGLDFVRALKPTEYQFKQGGRDSDKTDGKRRYGFLAQDVLPLEGDDPVIISADNPDKLQYTESHLIPVLVKAIQELTQEVDRLRAEVETLKNA